MAVSSASWPALQRSTNGAQTPENLETRCVGVIAMRSQGDRNYNHNHNYNRKSLAKGKKAYQEEPLTRKELTYQKEPLARPGPGWRSVGDTALARREDGR